MQAAADNFSPSCDFRYRYTPRWRSLCCLKIFDKVIIIVGEWRLLQIWRDLDILVYQENEKG